MKRKKKLSWQQTIENKKDVKCYLMSDSYYVGDFIVHNSFGLGYIQNSFADKIEVLFEDKVRLLKHMVMF